MEDTANAPESPGSESHGPRPEYAYAGFWLRFAALLADVAILGLAVTVAKTLLVRGNIYLPFELSLLLSLVVYNSVLVAWRRRTFGKALCGLTVLSAGGERASTGRAALRETIGKLVSFCGLGLGYVWVGLSRRKRGWHDYIAGTVVLRDVRARKRARHVLSVALLVSMPLLGLYLFEVIGLLLLVKQMAPPRTARPAYVGRQPSQLTDVSSLKPVDENGLLDWIESRGRSPVDYAVAKAQQHQVVIFGESHEREAELRYLNELIPELYRRANVTCVAMEVCLAEDNRLIDQLVSAKEFDRYLALRIARRQPWGIWGWKGYWDVFETVWRVNREVPPDKEKIRVIGLDMAMDMPSLAMLGVESNAAGDAPIWEKLRVWRLLLTLPRVLARDASFAEQVEKEIIRKGRRGIVWVGRNHSIIHAPQVFLPQKPWPRMGFMLHSRHAGEVFQIRLHGHDIPISLVDGDYQGSKPKMAGLLERIMQKRGGTPVGFDVTDSPFALLRDNGSLEYHFEPRLGFGDVASGYVFLAKRHELSECHWLPDYVTRGMFAANKPFYQAFVRRGGQTARTAREVNDFFGQAGGHN
jgi:uncharacterized RDD family membrane protein YckC